MISLLLQLSYDSKKSAQDGNRATGADESKGRGYKGPWEIGPTQNGGRNAGERHQRHSLLLGHGTAEVLRSSRRGAKRSHVSGQEGENGAEPAEERPPLHAHPGISRSYKNKNICNSVRQLVVDFPRLGLVPAFHSHHAIEEIA